MTTDEAIQKTIKEFPFPGYMVSADGEVKYAYANIANTVRKHLPVGSKILDLGCGPCDKTAILQHMGYQCWGIDDLQDVWHREPGNREKILDFAHGAGITFTVFEGGPMPYEKEFFDMVMMHDVLEHLHDSPRELLNNALEIVKPEGLIFVTVPNLVNIRKRLLVLMGKSNLGGYGKFYWYPGSWRGHVREYVHDDLVQMAEFMDCDVLELRSCDHMLQRVPPGVLVAYKAVTSVFRGWKDTWMLVAKKRPGWKPKREADPQELDRIMKSGMCH